MSARAALVCHRSTETGPITVEATYWDTTGQAREAEAELTPCGPLCIGVHTIARLDIEAVLRRSRRPSSLGTRTTSTAGPVAAGGADT